ncbi:MULTISPECIES: hypothetical protein [Microbacterium]|uniref:hypothetical protein n=1 Tax=Microbacterium TaxID=33882 RepID=UPI0012FD3DF0|nr:MULTISPECIES: hypothetical protein [Microbacterium]MDO8382352.1 hypothetical protein [Microbacterium sp.]
MTDGSDPDVALLGEVLRLLTRLDPYSLEPGGPDGVPADEYAFEARSIAVLLAQNGGVTADQVDAVWHEWFSEPLSTAVGEKPTHELVAALNALIGGREERTGLG